MSDRYDRLATAADQLYSASNAIGAVKLGDVDAETAAMMYQFQTELEAWADDLAEKAEE